MEQSSSMAQGQIQPLPQTDQQAAIRAADEQVFVFQEAMEAGLITPAIVEQETQFQSWFLGMPDA